MEPINMILVDPILRKGESEAYTETPFTSTEKHEEISHHVQRGWESK